MNKICVIALYFGRLPNYFNLWLKSVEANSTIDFMLFTDDNTKYDYPKNVIVHYISFDELVKKIQDKFDFRIAIKKPYKLCDIKPMFGYVFSDYLIGYDYWGHCDVDVIFGNIKKYLSEINIYKYDKVFRCGHFSLYRNTKKINNNFMELIENGTPKYITVLSNPENYIFDETTGILKLYDNKKYTIYKNKYCIADINVKYKDFNIYSHKKDKKYIFEWSKNKEPMLVGYCIKKKNIIKREFLYAHFQKRKMENCITNFEHLYIIPNSFVNELSMEKEKYLKGKNKYRKEYINMIKNRVINKIKKIYRR